MRLKYIWRTRFNQNKKIAMKKKLLYLLLLIPIFSGAQIVNIPDVNFKNKLLSASTSNGVAKSADGDFMVIDINGDLEIQQSEALLVYYLSVSTSTNIADLTGIEYFTNVKELWCYGNQISSLDVSGLTNLERLECANNNMNSINLTGLTSLVELNCRANQLTNIDLSNLTALEYVNCNQNQLNSIAVTGLSSIKSIALFSNSFTALDISMLSTLELLSIGENQLTSLNVSGLSNLTSLQVYTNPLANLSLEGLTSLENLYCVGNQLTSLDLTPCISLKTFDGSENQLTSVNITGLQNLTSLVFDNNLITNLNIDNYPTLTGISMSGNPLTSFEINNVPMLEYINCSGTLLVNLDLSNCPALQYMTCRYNTLLETVNIKNGGLLIPFFDTDFSNNPNLNFICIDDGEEVAMETALGDELPPYSSYCSFTPGGDYNTITGTMLFDADGDGACDDLSHEFMKIHIDDGVNEGDTFSNGDNEYIFYTGAGDFTITPQFENDWFVATPQDAYVSFPESDNLVYTQDFCITALGEHPDVEVVMVPVVAARPGFDAVYKVVYKNKGNQVLSGSVTCGWNYSVLTGVAINPLPDMIVPGTYTWNYTDLKPFENREILMTLHVNSPTDTPPVDSGDILPFTASVESGGTDETPEDNTFVFDQEVVNSLDPNNIICIEGETASPDAIGDYLHYVVNFENTGTAAASFIVIKHEINPADFDIRSLQVLNSSHDVRVKVNGNFVEFIFENINLAAEDHGNILIKLKSMETLQAGDNVMNAANIYFDYNYPLETNEATTVFEILDRQDFEVDNTITVYPNPTNGLVNIKAASVLQSIELYDIQGRLLQTGTLKDTQADLDMSQRQTGIYLLKISTHEGVKVERIIKN